MNITVIGGGNVGTLIAGLFQLKNNKVTIYTRDETRWSKEITIVDNDTNTSVVYSPTLITSDKKKALEGADIIFITLPAFAIKEFLDDSSKYIKEGAWVGFYPGTGGVEFVSRKLLDKGCVIFGSQRICSVVRLAEYGKKVVTTGKRDEMFIGVIPKEWGSKVRDVFASLFDIKTTLLPNYLNVTLTPSNPILHPSRLYTLYKDYYMGKVYDKVDLFYEGWTDETSKVLIECDKELQNIIKNIDIDTSYIKSLLVHYESSNYHELTKKIHSIRGFKGIESPKLKVDNGYIPDLNNRYFTADFPYGLAIIKNFAMILKIECPMIDKVLSWYQDIVSKKYIDFSNNKLGDDAYELSLPQLYGINSSEDIIRFYTGESYNEVR